jgi:prepilin-type N-terminal cleavage/methylation domain-containing protein
MGAIQMLMRGKKDRPRLCLRLERLARDGRGTHGFSLVELAIASAILAIAIAGVLAIASTGHRQLDDIRRTARADQIIQQKIEDLRNIQNFASIMSATGTFTDPKDPTAKFIGTVLGTTSFRTVTGTNTYSIGDFGANFATYSGQQICRQVTVAVSWKGLNGVTHTRSMTAVFTRNGLNDYVFPP